MLIRPLLPAPVLAALTLFPPTAPAQDAPPPIKRQFFPLDRPPSAAGVPAAEPASAEPAPSPAVAAAHARIEALRRETALLEALRAAQLRLIAWSEASAPVGRAPSRLPASLCAEPDLAAWCAALPATFGRPVR